MVTVAVLFILAYAFIVWGLWFLGFPVEGPF